MGGLGRDRQEKEGWWSATRTGGWTVVSLLELSGRHITSLFPVCQKAPLQWREHHQSFGVSLSCVPIERGRKISWKQNICQSSIQIRRKAVWLICTTQGTRFVIKPPEISMRPNECCWLLLTKFKPAAGSSWSLCRIKEQKNCLEESDEGFIWPARSLQEAYRHQGQFVPPPLPTTASTDAAEELPGCSI